LIIECVRCHKKFDRGNSVNKRICDDRDCHPKKKKSKLERHYHFHSYMGQIKRYIQNPIYQWRRMQHSEELNKEVQYGDY